MPRSVRWGWQTMAMLATVTLVATLAAATRADPGASPPAAVADPAVACRDLRAGAMVACLHGNDAPPPGVDLYHRPTLQELEARSSLGSPDPRLRGLAGLEQATGSAGPAGSTSAASSASSAEAAPAAVSCIGNGTSGNRIQVIYARALDVPDQYDALLPSLREWAAEADQATWASAGQTGGSRRLRFVTDQACQLEVARVQLSPLGDDTFSQMRTELRLLGYNRSDRKYLVWVDAAVGICGLGEVYGDQQPGPENRNNRGPSYARVDRPCWQYAELHEIFHTLGAVQPDAPHPSAVWHCTDEADVMCYDDDGAGPVVMTSVCPPEQEALLDCGDDDYFSTNPPPGSYLANAWNTADSSFLQDVDGPRLARLTLTGAATITYGGRADLRAQLSDQETGDGIQGGAVNLFARPAGAYGEQAAGTATSNASGAAAFTPAPAATTVYRAAFPGSDTHGPAGSAQATVSVRPKVTARFQDATITYGQSVTATGSVAPNHAGQRVYLQRLVNGAWKTAATATLSSTSGYTLRAKPPAKGRLSYRVYKGADADHVAGASPTLTVTVG